MSATRTPRPVPSGRVNEMDLLRFLAAMAVVFYHYAFRGHAADDMSAMPYPLLANVARYGYLGVDLFFIISGFVILMTAANGSLRSFLVSRIVRLYPAFWACCTLTFVLTLLLGGYRYRADLSQYLVNLTMLSEFFHVEAIDGVYWSLFVELRFYALVTLLLLCGRIDQIEPILVGWLVATVLLLIWPIRRLNTWLITDYSANFIAGATCFLIWSRGQSARRVGLLVMAWILALWQAMHSLPGLEQHYDTRLSSITVAGIITVFFLVMFLVATRCTGVFARRRWVLAGALTYPLYLLHQHIGFMIFNLAYPAVNAHLLFCATIAGMLGLAYLVHVQVERRFSRPLKDGIDRLLDGLRTRYHPLS